MNELWELPCASTAFLGGPTFEVLPARRAALHFEYEGNAGIKQGRLLIHGIEVFKCSYLTACSYDMTKGTYDKLVDLGRTPWLSEVTKVSEELSHRSKSIKHLAIFFDDGPFYEFLAEGFEIEIKNQ